VYFGLKVNPTYSTRFTGQAASSRNGERGLIGMVGDVILESVRGLPEISIRQSADHLKDWNPPLRDGRRRAIIATVAFRPFVVIRPMLWVAFSRLNRFGSRSGGSDLAYVLFCMVVFECSGDISEAIDRL
jgi:hypothetical protein